MSKKRDLPFANTNKMIDMEKENKTAKEIIDQAGKKKKKPVTVVKGK